MTNELTSAIGIPVAALYRHVCEHEDASDNSVCETIGRGLGLIASKTITLNANNTSASVNVFQITRTIHVIKLYGFVLDATVLNNCTNVYFDLYDGTNSPDLTDSTGVALSGVAVDTYFMKLNSKSADLVVANNSQCRISETSASEDAMAPHMLFKQFGVTQKTGTNTYIRLNYTTTDAPINAQLTIFCEYAPLDGGTLVAA